MPAKSTVEIDLPQGAMLMSKMSLTWLGGNPGDGWYEMTEGLVALLNALESDVTLELAAGGGEENLAKIGAGEGHLGMSIDVVVSSAVNGGDPFDAPMSRLRCIGTGWSGLPYNLLKAASATGDLRAAFAGGGLRIGAPPEDTTDELIFQRVVRFYDTSYDGISRRGGRVLLAGYDDLIAALHEHEIDYVFGATTMPAPSIARAGEGARDVELVPLPEGVVDHLVGRYGCRRGIIPASVYPDLLSGDDGTAFVQTVFVTTADVEETAVFEVTRLLLENLDALPDVHPTLAEVNPYTAWRHVPAPVHPGAARAFRELGFMS